MAEENFKLGSVLVLRYAQRHVDTRSPAIILFALQRKVNGNVKLPMLMERRHGPRATKTHDETNFYEYIIGEYFEVSFWCVIL